MVKRGHVTVDEELYIQFTVGILLDDWHFTASEVPLSSLMGLKRLLCRTASHMHLQYTCYCTVGFGDNTHESQSLFDLFSGPRHPKSLLDLKPAVQSLHEIYRHLIELS